MLTTGIDTVAGTAANDTFGAALELQDPTDAGTVTQTLTAFDEVNGGEGVDRLNATLNSADADSVLITDVENIYLRSRDDTSAIDMENVSGAEQLWSDRSTNDLALTNVANGVAVGLNKVAAGADYSVTYAANALGTPTHTQTVVANGAGTAAAEVALNIVAAGADVITGLNVATTGVNNITLGAGLADVETLTVTGSGSLDLDGAAAPAALETVAAADYTGDLSLAAANGTLQSVTSGSGDDSFTLGGDLADEGFVNTGAGDDEVDTDGNNVDAGASIDLGAGDDVVMFGGGVVDKDATVDGGDGTDTLQLQAVGAANIGAFSNFEVFDVADLNKTLDLDILASENDVAEIVGSDALGGASTLTKLGAGVGFRATGDMGATELTLTQKTAGEITVTLDVDQAATAGPADDNDATTTVDLTNATSVNAVFDSASVNEIGGAISNTQTITLETDAATSLNIVSGGENAANVLALTDDSDDGGDSELTEITITGDQSLDLSDITVNAGTNNLATVDASGMTGGLTIEIADLANNAEVTLGSGADVVDAEGLGSAEADLESIVGFEKSASTTDADLIAEADLIDFGGTEVVGTGTATANASAADNGIVTFLGTGPSTLDEAIGFVDALGLADNAVVAFEYVGDTYIFGEGVAANPDDSVIKLSGVTGVDALGATNGDIFIA